jgi:PBP1b-binding outer membrane lipoprotein LpoB
MKMKKVMLVLGLASVMMACGSKGSSEAQVEEVQAIDSTAVEAVEVDSTAVEAVEVSTEEAPVQE